MNTETTLIVALTADSILQASKPDSIYTFILPRYIEETDMREINLPAIFLVLMMAYLSDRISYYSAYLRKVKSIYNVTITPRHIGTGNLPYVFELKFDANQTYIILGDSRLEILTERDYHFWLNAQMPQPPHLANPLTADGTASYSSLPQFPAEIYSSIRICSYPLSTEVNMIQTLPAILTWQTGMDAGAKAESTNLQPPKKG